MHQLSFSPIKGPEGNIEYLLYIQNIPQTTEKEEISEENFLSRYGTLIRETVDAAHGKLDHDNGNGENV